MSVPAYKRNISSSEYLANAFRLVAFSFIHLIKVPKRLTKYITEPFIEHLHKMYSLVIRFKNIYYREIGLSKDTKLNLCYEILGELDYLGSILEILHNMTDSINSNIYNEWTEYINNELNLINGIIKSINKDTI